MTLTSEVSCSTDWASREFCKWHTIVKKKSKGKNFVMKGAISARESAPRGDISILLPGVEPYSYYSQETYFFLLIRFKIIYMYIINISHTQIPNFLWVFSTIRRQLESLVSLLFTANVVLRIRFRPYYAWFPPSHIRYGMTIAILILTIRWHCTYDGVR